MKSYSLHFKTFLGSFLQFISPPSHFKSPRSLVKEPYDLSQNSPFPLWKKLLSRSQCPLIYLKRKMTQGLNGRMVQSTKNIKYIKRNLHLNARVWTGEWSAILLKIYIKNRNLYLYLSELITQGLSGRMECQPPAPGVGKFGEHKLLHLDFSLSIFICFW